jgi:hypothetical protein
MKACTRACKLVNFNIDDLLKVTMVIFVVLHGGKKRGGGGENILNYFVGKKKN